MTDSTVAAIIGWAAGAGSCWYVAALFADRPDELMPVGWRRALVRVLQRGWWPSYLLIVGATAVLTIWWLRGEYRNDSQVAALLIGSLVLGAILGLRPIRHYVQLQEAERKRRAAVQEQVNVNSSREER